MKMTDYTATRSLTEDNIFLVDGDGGTKKISVADAILSALHVVSVENHRRVFRGKFLGTSLTTAQKTAIQNGTFEDLWLGDYWTINGVNWRIADFDYWYNTGDGDTPFVKHHLVVVPDTYLYAGVMNNTSITTGGYVGSVMYKSGLTRAKTLVNNAFGDAVLTHREFLSNTVSNGVVTGGDWYDSTVEIMNELMVYGAHIHASYAAGTARYTIDKTQLALFAVAPRFMNTTQSFWLRDVSMTTQFCNMGYYSSAGSTNASSEYGVRPVFAIG